MRILSETQLRDELASVMEAAMYLTMGEVLEELKDIIIDEVYGIGTPKMYERTNEFYESWETDKRKIAKNVIQGSIFQNLLVMHEDREKFQHVINNLAEVINEGIADKWAMGEGWWSQKRPFWDKFVEYLDGNLEKIYMKNLSMLGLTIKK